MAVEDDFDVFAIPDFWQTSRLLQPLSPSEFFHDISTSHQANDRRTLTRSPSDPKVSEETSQIHVYSPTVNEDGFFRLPPLLDASQKPALPSDTDGKDANETTSESAEDESGALGDIWLSQGELPEVKPEAKTWESFTSPGSGHVLPAFLSESGPAAFDAAISAEGDPLRIRNFDHGIVDTAAFVFSLQNLALGRESILFTWNEEKRQFRPAMDKMRISGYTGHILSGLVDSCTRCGTRTRLLRSLAKRLYTINPSPCRVALADALDAIVSAIQKNLESRARRIKSLAQLQAAVRPAEAIISVFAKVAGQLYGADNDEALLSMLFHEVAASDFETRLVRDLMREVLRRTSEPFLRFVEEWIGTKAESPSPVDKQGQGKSFVKVHNRVWIDDQGFELEEPDFFLDEERMPSFVPRDLAQTMFETGRNMRFLRASHPEHPLSQGRCIGSSRPPSIQWYYDWDALMDLERRALKFERSLRKAIKKRRENNGGLDASSLNLSHEPTGYEQRLEHNKELDASLLDSNHEPTGYELKLFGHEPLEIEQGILASIGQLSKPLEDSSDHDSLARIIRAHLGGDSTIPTSSKSVNSAEFTPHLSLLPLLSFGPTVAAQARVVNAECMRLLFRSHGLRAHLALQRDFHLLGSGVFCSRLSHALFDPDTATAERRAGVALMGGSMGLRLAGRVRDNWPPASSELRLALIGVLSDSYRGGHGPQATTVAATDTRDRDLPGDLSFAVRDLSEDDMQRCMDPDGLEALDFLRLSYKTPPALAAVITPTALYKYDAIFKLLLRVLRLLFVTDQLFREMTMNGRLERRGQGRRRRLLDQDPVELRFRFEARRFVAAVASHFFDTAIAMPWRRFEAELDAVEAGLAEEEDGDGVLGRSAGHLGPDWLCARHEAALDDMSSTLLMLRRQRPVMQVLEDVFALVLRFAAVVGSRPRKTTAGTGKEDIDGEAESRADEVRRLYGAFKQKADLFTAVCRGLAEKGDLATTMRASGDGAHIGDDSVISQLLMKLDMSTYSTL